MLIRALVVSIGLQSAACKSKPTSQAAVSEPDAAAQATDASAEKAWSITVTAAPLTTGDIARGEIAWGLIRGSVYSAAFLLVMLGMGLVESWWAVLALPAAILIAFAFSAVCMALTTWMKSWQDFDKITLAQMPLFLFSATFFPVEAFGNGVLRWVVEATPLYRGVVLCRELTTGIVTWESAVSVVYLVAMGGAGLLVVRRRLDTLLLT